MSIVTKSPRKAAAVAFEIGARTLSDYSHRFSRRDFTQPQLFTCLVLKRFFKTDYRGIVAILRDWPSLCEDMGMAKIPHFTTLQKSEHRLLRDPKVRAMLGQTVTLLHEEGSYQKPTDTPPTAYAIDRAAADSTGFETDRACRYFVKRRSSHDRKLQRTTYRRFGKLGLVCDCDTHMILATHHGVGPKPDVGQLRGLLGAMVDNVIPDQMLADAGYDSEANHMLLREELGIESIIPPLAGRPGDSLPTGKWRFLMATEFDEETYGQRWQVETVMFMLKTHQGPAPSARKYQTRRREMGLMSITHNIMIVDEEEGFYRALPTPFPALQRPVHQHQLIVRCVLPPAPSPPLRGSPAAFPALDATGG